MSKRKISKESAEIIISSLFVIYLILGIASFPFHTVFYQIYSQKISKPVRIAHISDLHTEYYGKDMKNLLDEIDRQSPDVIVLTGDIFNERSENENTRKFLTAAAKKYPCFYVSGNHEFRNNSWKSFRDEAKKLGVTVLEGEKAEFMGITVFGASPDAEGTLSFSDSVEKCAENAGDGFNILLAHYPEQIDFYRSFGKFDLILSGHAHGGQWRIPYLINGVFAPEQGFFPKYAGGRFDFDNETLIVSRGLSRTNNFVPRIFNNPELVIIDILPESEEHN